MFELAQTATTTDGWVVPSVIGVGQLIALAIIIWKGGRWTSCIEAKIGELTRRFDEHLADEFADLRTRVGHLERERIEALKRGKDIPS